MVEGVRGRGARALAWLRVRPPPRDGKGRTVAVEECRRAPGRPRPGPTPPGAEAMRSWWGTVRAHALVLKASPRERERKGGVAGQGGKVSVRDEG